MSDPRELDTNIGIFGRSEEIKAFHQTFATVQQNKVTQLVTVGGYSGTGKSRLVEAFSEGIKDLALYCSGKCEPTKIHEPYWVLKDALKDLCTGMVSTNNNKEWIERSLPTITQHIQAALGDEGSLLVEVVPELVVLVREAPPHDLPPPDAHQNNADNDNDHGGNDHDHGDGDNTNLMFAKDRINYLFRSLVGAITKSLPLVLFCDDLQWVDRSSLEIISGLVTDHKVNNLLLIASYRDNEVDDTHPVTAELNKIKETKGEETISHISVKNLSLQQLNALVARVLQQDAHDTQDLSVVIHEKTHGNVFYSLQLLKVLNKENLLSFSVLTMKWTWVDVDKIRFNTDLGDNVVSMIANKLKKLPHDVQQTLLLASCLSSGINPRVISTVMSGLQRGKGREASVVDVRSTIDRATEEGLLLRERVFSGDHDGPSDNVYRFAHDRIQQAAYSLLPEGSERERLHYDIGNVLMESREAFPEAEQSLIGFIIPNQLQHGRVFITKEEDLVRFARLNFEAGKKAMSMAAFVPATEYFRNGREALKDTGDAWEKCYSVQMEMHQHLADMLWSSGSPSESEEIVNEMLPHVRSVEQTLRVHFTLANALGVQLKIREALDVSVEQMVELGLLPKRFRALKAMGLLLKNKKKLKKMSIDDVLQLPLCTDPIVNQAHATLRMISKQAYFVGDKIMQVACTGIIVDLTMKHGINREVLTGFAYTGLFVNLLFGDLEEGCRLGEMTIALMRKWNCIDMPGVIAVYGILDPWRKPLNDMLQHNLDAFKAGMKMGDVEYACGSFHIYINHGYLAGLALQPLLQDAESHAQTCKRHGNKTMFGGFLPIQQMLQSFVGPCEDPSTLRGSVITDEQGFIESYADHTIAQFNFYLQKTVLCFHFGRYVEADEALTMLRKFDDGIVFFSEVSQRMILRALVPLASASRTGKRVFLRRTKAALKVIRKAVTKGKQGMNIAHLMRTIEAGYLALVSPEQEDKVKRLFDKAIAQSNRIGYRQDAAVAYRLAGDYFLRRDDTDWAEYYISKAVELYDDWGAKEVANYLRIEYGDKVNLCFRRSLHSQSTAYKSRRRHQSFMTTVLDNYVTAEWDQASSELFSSG